MLTTNRMNRVLPILSGDPWSLMAAVGGQFLKDLEGVTNASPAPVRVAKSDNALLFEIDLPGRSVEDIDVALEGRLLEVQAHAPAMSSETNVVRAERSRQPLTLKWRLPFEPQADHTQVTYEHGVLRILVHQAPSSARKKLDIQIS